MLSFSYLWNFLFLGKANLYNLGFLNYKSEGESDNVKTYSFYLKLEKLIPTFGSL